MVLSDFITFNVISTRIIVHSDLKGEDTSCHFQEVEISSHIRSIECEFHLWIIKFAHKRRH